MALEPRDPSGAPAPEPKRPASSARRGDALLTEREQNLLRRRSIARHRSNLMGNPVVKGVAFLLGLALVAALVVDLTRTARRFRDRPAIPSDQDPAALALGIRDRSYQDPQGRFRITVPEAWAVLRGEDIAPFDVRFAGPRGMEISLLAAPAESERFDLLLRKIRKIEDDYGVNMNIRTNVFQGYPSVERTTRMVHKTVRALDFIARGQSHHLQGSAPRETFADSEAFLTQLLGTYEPGPFPESAAPAAKPGPPAAGEPD